MRVLPITSRAVASLHRGCRQYSTALAAWNTPGADFELRPTLVGPTLLLRPMGVDDLEPLYRYASDTLLWADHPASDRYNRPVFEQWFRDALDYGSTLVAVDTRTGDAIGSSRYYLLDTRRQEVAIGFTWLARPHWGGATNAAMKSLMLAHAFEQRVGIKTVWFHIAPSNTRSQIATTRIGASLSHSEVIPAIGDAVQLCFKMTREQYCTGSADPKC